MSSGTTRLKIRRIGEGRARRVEDVVIKERPATIFLDDAEVITLMCSPERLDYLAAGFLFSEGFLSGRKEIARILVDKKEGVVWVNTKKGKTLPANATTKRIITTGCGRGLTFVDPFERENKIRINSRFVVSASRVPLLMKELHRKSRLFKTTGGAHSAAICSSKTILAFNEDIGRHSAIDKVIGECLLKGIRSADRILLTSGRLSSEILVKAARSRIPIVISKSAPTDLAIKLAEDFGVTLVGFARGSRMNIYSNGWRIRSSPPSSRSSR